MRSSSLAKTSLTCSFARRAGVGANGLDSPMTAESWKQSPAYAGRPSLDHACWGHVHAVTASVEHGSRHGPAGSAKCLHFSG